MNFHYSESFYLLIPFAIVIGLFLWSRWQRLRELARLGDWRLVKQLVPIAAIKRRRNKDLIALVVLFLVILAAAGPQFGSKLKEVKQRGVDVFIAMDTSRSMLAEDVPPTRLERAKRALGVLIDKLQGNRIGIIAFAKRAVIQCPLTSDTDAARMFLEVLDDKAVPEQGTSIGDAIRLALESFPKDDKSGRAIVLLTDGEDHSSDPTGAAKEAKKQGVVLFTIGIGTSKGEVIKDRDENGKVVSFHKYNGEMVMSRMDDGLLNEIATLTNGRYYRASSTDAEIDEIADALNGFDKKEFASKIYERLQERYQIVLLLALLLLLIEFFFAENPGQGGRVYRFLNQSVHLIPKRRQTAASIVAVLLVFPAIVHADYKDHVREGNKLLRKGKPTEARAAFEQARIDLPEAPFLPYNIAATYYLEGNFDEAKKQYELASSLTQNPALKSKIAYNMGHLLFNSGQSAQAIEKFKECLKLNPKDVDAKYNIEYIQAGKKPKNPPPQQQKKDGKGGDKQQQQGKEGQKGSEENKQDSNSNGDQKKPGDMSKENAERVLQMMKDQESEKMRDAQIPKVGLKKPKDKKDEQGGEDW